MSDDRSDRAARIQRMREGRRGDSSARQNGDDHEEATTDEGMTETDADQETASDDSAEQVMEAAAIETPTEAVDAAPTTESDALDDEIAEALDGLNTADVSSTDIPTEAVDAGGPSTDESDDAADEETISVLEFDLGDERYCLDITYIEQIVERGTVTRIPNAPPFVDGVIDLRGDITTVIDPTETLATDRGGDGGLIVVFDSDRMDDDWSVGWAVDGVRRVSTVSLAEIKDSPVDEPWINGVVKRDDDGEFVIWTEPGELMRVDEENV